MAKKNKETRPGRLPQFIETQTRRARRNVTEWQSALQQAENVENPNRVRLYDIYDHVLLDAHLTAELQKRTTAVTGTGFSLIDANGDSDPEKTKLLETPWFFKYLNLAMEARPWGHSLIELGEIDENGQLTDVRIVPRRHVIPEKGLFVTKQGDTNGVYYREDPQVVNWLVEIGEPKDLGLLNKATPHVLYKRFAQGAWAEFCEIFGMPVRVGKTNSRDENARNTMAKMLAEMGTAAYAVIDDDEEIEFLKADGSAKGEVYSGLMNASNAEISKLVNGAVIGEASQGGSRSKEEVGLDVQKMITAADLQWVEGYVNSQLIPKLILLGYDLDGMEFEFERSKDVEALWKMTKQALDVWEADDEMATFIRQEFGIPVSKKKQATANGGATGGFFV